jgi:hypothetical protein
LYRIVELKEDPYYWYLALAILILAFEAVFTLTIKVIQMDNLSVLTPRGLTSRILFS